MTTATRTLAPRRGADLLGAVYRRGDAVVTALRTPATAARIVQCAGAAFAVLALLAAFAEPLLLVLDEAVQHEVISARTDVLDGAMKALTFLGTRWVTGLVTVVVVAWSLLTGRGRGFAVLMAVAFLANPVFEVGFKELVDRARPDLARLLPGNGPSFPSGHVLASVGTFGLLPLLVWEQSSRVGARVVAWVASLAVIGVVAFSRVYLDVHWTSDVVAGLLLGTALVATSYQVLRAARSPAQRPAGRSAGTPTPNIGVAQVPHT